MHWLLDPIDVGSHPHGVQLIAYAYRFGGSVHGLVPDSVEERLRQKKLARETLRA